MNDTTITVQGYVGGTVNFRQAGPTDVATFRVGCTPRYFSRRTNAWADGETQWYTVNAWRGMARNVAESLVKGDAVGVHGRLNVSTWTDPQGQTHQDHQIEAIFVGHDLNRGVTKLRRPEKPAVADPANPWEVPAATVLVPEEGDEPTESTEGETPAEGEERRDPLTGWESVAA